MHWHLTVVTLVTTDIHIIVWFNSMVLVHCIHVATTVHVKVFLLSRHTSNGSYTHLVARVTVANKTQLDGVYIQYIYRMGFPLCSVKLDYVATTLWKSHSCTPRLLQSGHWRECRNCSSPLPSPRDTSSSVEVCLRMIWSSRGCRRNTKGTNVQLVTGACVLASQYPIYIQCNVFWWSSKGRCTYIFLCDLCHNIRVVEKLQSDLESERVRREGLEMQVDRLTLKLHQTQERLDQAEELLRMQLVQTRQVGWSMYVRTCTSKRANYVVS